MEKIDFKLALYSGRRYRNYWVVHFLVSLGVFLSVSLTQSQALAGEDEADPRFVCRKHLASSFLSVKKGSTQKDASSGALSDSVADFVHTLSPLPVRDLAQFIWTDQVNFVKWERGVSKKRRSAALTVMALGGADNFLSSLEKAISGSDKFGGLILDGTMEPNNFSEMVSEVIDRNTQTGSHSVFLQKLRSAIGQLIRENIEVSDKIEAGVVVKLIHLSIDLADTSLIDDYSQFFSRRLSEDVRYALSEALAVSVRVARIRTPSAEFDSVVARSMLEFTRALKFPSEDPRFSKHVLNVLTAVYFLSRTNFLTISALGKVAGSAKISTALGRFEDHKSEVIENADAVLEQHGFLKD